MARQEFPRAVKVAAIKRATVNGQVYFKIEVKQ